MTLANVRRMTVAAGAVALSMVCWAVGSLSADAQEYVVSQEVVSDTQAAPCASGDCGDSYVGDVSASAAGVGGRTYGHPDLFYNFYTQGGANQANAQLYVAPLPTPPHVGHTFYTYQPFYPHELLYAHSNRFHKYYDEGRGYNRTRVTYSYPPVRQTASNFYWNFLRIPR